jgi:hypothetical protein
MVPAEDRVSADPKLLRGDCQIPLLGRITRSGPSKSGFTESLVLDGLKNYPYSVGFRVSHWRHV